MIFQNIKVVAFDCDGVMFDSSSANQAFYNQVLNHFGLPDMTLDQFRFVHMSTVDEALAFLIQDSETLKAATAFCRQMSYLPFIRFMVAEPYLQPLLMRLRPLYKTAIATNRTNTMAKVLEEHSLEGQFDKVVTAGDVRHAKPHPEQLLTLLDYFGVDPDQMIYIGDSEVDAMAARQANVAFIAYDNPDLKADVHIRSLRQVEALLINEQ